MCVLAAVVALLLAAPPSPAADKKPASQSDSTAAAAVVAVVGDTSVTAATLEGLVRSRLVRLQTEEYNTKRAVLEEHLGKILLSKEAEARKIGVDELIAAEIDGKARAVEDTEMKAVYEATKDRFGPLPESEALKQIESSLRSQRRAARRFEYLRELRGKYGVKVLLEPPRVAIAANAGPSIGPGGAGVKIVEFSDFECPFCARVAPALKQAAEHYGERIQVSFRNFPLPMHRSAGKAAEAAACANDQGRFWEMHDKMFGNQQALQASDLKRYAQEVSLDSDVFAQCLDSSKHSSEIQDDKTQGMAYGVSSTPTLFINGRFLSGAVPYDVLSQIIDEELDRFDAAQRPLLKRAVAGRASE